MTSAVKTTLIVVVAIVVVGLLARFVVFKQQFEDFGDGLERIGQWETDYRREHPQASDAEVDAAFKASMANIELWQAKYKAEHPNATKAEMDAAFTALFSGN